MKSKFSRRVALRLVLFGSVFMVAVAYTLVSSNAVNRTWTGNGIINPNPSFHNNLWTNPFNWSGNSLPISGDDLIFPLSALQKQSINSFPENTSFNSIKFDGTGYLLAGSPVALSTGIFANVAGGNQVSLPIRADANIEFNAVADATLALGAPVNNNGFDLGLVGAGTVIIGNQISGAGPLIRGSSGVSFLTANNTYTGSTAVSGGTLIVLGSQPQSAVSLSGTLGGTGTVGPVSNVLFGALDPGGLTGSSAETGILNIAGDITLHNVIGAGSTFRFDLNGTVAGSGYDQLNVMGQITLAETGLTIDASFAPPPGTSFTLINNDGTDLIEGRFFNRFEGDSFTVGSTTFVITYRGGDGNDVVLHVPQTKTWDGGGASNNWTDSANWSDNIAPQIGDDLVFPTGAMRLANTNDFPANTTFNSVTISGGGYTLSGNTIRLKTGLTDNHQAIGTTNTISLAIHGFATLDMNAHSTGRLVLSNTNTFTGDTTLNSGNLTINGNLAVSTVVVNGGVLAGSGSVRSINANGGQVKPGTGGPPTGTGDTLRVTGNVSLSNSSLSVFFRDVHTTQLDVAGTISISNSDLLITIGSSVSDGANFTFINNDGTDPINGSFKLRPEGSVFVGSPWAFRVTYLGNTGNDLVFSNISALLINDVSVTEGNSGTTNATFTVGLSFATNQTVTVNFATSNITAQAGSDYVSTSGTLTFNPNETSKTFTVPVIGDSIVEPDEGFRVTLSNAINAGIGLENGLGIILNDDFVSTIQFGASTYTSNEGDHFANVTVNRSGGTTQAVSVQYQTSDGTATERKDYTTTIGTLRFEAGETQKTFAVLLTDDGFAESTETVNLSLSNPTGGAQIGILSTATLNISDNEAGVHSSTNPNDDPLFFVRMHYHDFLNREPDAGGLQFWSNEIIQCGGNPQCVENKRINVSAAFFLSIEFQETGYLVYRIYKSAFGNLPGKPVPVQLRPFLKDTTLIGEGVQVGIGNWEQQLEQNKQRFTEQFVGSTQFLTAFPLSMSQAEFVDTMNTNSGGALSQLERDALVADLTSGAKTRAQVLRAIAEDQNLRDAELRKAFVLMQYFGYLRRNPDDVGFNGLPDPNFDGFNFWLNKLNEFNGNFVQAEMVKAFIFSIEYRERFR